MRKFQMLPVGLCLPGMDDTGTRAVWPVWKNSAREKVRFHARTKKAEATRIWHQLRNFECKTRTPGRQDGAVTRNGLAVAHAMIFDFLNFRTGQLDPAYETIATKAGISRSSVARGIIALRAIGFLTWIRRCIEVMRDGRYSLEQESNAYAIHPPSQWKGYKAPPEAPPPEAGTWGDHPCGTRDALTEAVTEAKHGGKIEAQIRQLEHDPGDRLAAALARLGRSMEARSLLPVPECQPDTETSLRPIAIGRIA